MAEHITQGLIGTAMENIRELVDVNTIIGEPIQSPDGTIIIPVSKVSFGFVAGGSDIPAKVTKDVFAGGTSAGVTISPQAFIVISGGDVKMLQMNNGKNHTAIDSIIEGAPDLIEKVKSIFKKDNFDNKENTDM